MLINCWANEEDIVYFVFVCVLCFSVVCVCALFMIFHPLNFFWTEHHNFNSIDNVCTLHLSPEKSIFLAFTSFWLLWLRIVVPSIASPNSKELLQSRTNCHRFDANPSPNGLTIESDEPFSVLLISFLSLFFYTIFICCALLVSICVCVSVCVSVSLPLCFDLFCLIHTLIPFFSRNSTIIYISMCHCCSTWKRIIIELDFCDFSSLWFINWIIAEIIDECGWFLLRLFHSRFRVPCCWE